MQLKTVLLGLFLLLIQTREEARTLSLLLPTFQVKVSVYVGTWVGYTANGSEFKIVLRERKGFKMVNGKSYDVIVGNHVYVSRQGGAKNESLSMPKSEFSLIGMSNNGNPDKLEAIFSDEVNHKRILVTLTFVNGSKKALRWLLKEELETMTINAKEKTLRGISVPTDIILKKVD